MSTAALAIVGALELARLTTHTVRHPDEIRSFFDALAGGYRERHGDADRLLRYRLWLIRSLLNDAGRSCLVEIGCGDGVHLYRLAGSFETVIGTDLSPAMIAAAEAKRAAHPDSLRVRLAADRAEQLTSVQDGVADAVLCVGAFEHMPDKARVLNEVARVLQPGGTFVCLSPNGGWLWYTSFAPRLRLQTRHLSTDRFVDRNEWRALLHAAGLHPLALGSWRFIPAGDMPGWAVILMSALDVIGAALRIASLRGGCYAKAVKPLR